MPADEPRKVQTPVTDLPGVRKALEKGEKKRALMTAGRLFRVKHPAYGSKEVEAKDETDAAREFAKVHNPGNAKNKEWVERFAQECRIAKLSPPAAAAA